MIDKESRDKATNDTEIAKIGEAFDVMVEASGSVYKNAQYLSKVAKPMLFSIVGLVAIVVGLQIQLIFRENRIDQLKKQISTLEINIKNVEDAAKEAKTASVEAQTASQAAKTSLDEAVAQAQRGGVSPEVLNALQRVNELYVSCVQQKEC